MGSRLTLVKPKGFADVGYKRKGSQGFLSLHLFKESKTNCINII